MLVIAVGAVNSKGERSEGSATGDDLELMAPGEQILSTGDFGGILVSSGTSMAAPHVTGVASILWQKDLSCSSDFIRKLLDISANLYGDKDEYGYGLIDLAYALEQYDAFKAVYTEEEPLDDIIEESQENGELLNNTSEVITFDDIDYVEGSWDSDAHEELAGEDSYDSHKPLSAAGLRVVKLGAVANDKKKYGVKGFNEFPQFHGFMSKQVGTPTYQSNYIASYIYLTDKAVGLYNDMDQVNPSCYISSYDQDGIDDYLTDSGLNGNSWKKLLDGNTVNDKNKALFVYGMALHSVTDLFAHSTYDKDGNYISHGLGADDWYNISNRHKCAHKMASKVVAHIKRFESGDISDFYTVAEEAYDKKKQEFHVGRYSEYAEDIDEDYYNDHSDAFDRMNFYR